MSINCENPNNYPFPVRVMRLGLTPMTVAISCINSEGGASIASSIGKRVFCIAQIISSLFFLIIFPLVFALGICIDEKFSKSVLGSYYYIKGNIYSIPMAIFIIVNPF
jgi:hypothetical protein